MFKLIVAPQAKKEISKLKVKYRRWIITAIRELREDPYLGKALTREYTGRLSLKVGVYRVIYKVEKKEKCVLIIAVGHRSTIYN